jgi:hypothetical protein
VTRSNITVILIWFQQIFERRKLFIHVIIFSWILFSIWLLYSTIIYWHSFDNLQWKIYFALQVWLNFFVIWRYLFLIFSRFDNKCLRNLRIVRLSHHGGIRIIFASFLDIYFFQWSMNVSQRRLVRRQNFLVFFFIYSVINNWIFVFALSCLNITIYLW